LHIGPVVSIKNYYTSVLIISSDQSSKDKGVVKKSIRM
jgi:hypothetical protein